MPILCFEGPSAVGKTTTAAALTAAAGAYIVPEVHFLFERPEHEAPEWYVERQVDRWQLATAAAQRHPLVVLDGDPYQPLWYNWAFNFAGWQELDFLEALYRPHLARGELSFPDRYIVFRASHEALRQRKQDDLTRQRRGFESHLRFIEPQQRYFAAMHSFAPDRVCFLAAQDVEESVRTISTVVAEVRSEQQPVKLFDCLIRWLRHHLAA